MSSKRVIAICQSGGEFKTDESGYLSYEGGDAYAVDVDQEMKLRDFKKELADTFNCSVDTISLKYFLPGNKKTLITISKDKDLKRMVDFCQNSDQVDVFVEMTEERAMPRLLLNTPSSRMNMAIVQEDVTMVTPLNRMDGVAPIGMIQSTETAPSEVTPAVDIDSRSKVTVQWENAITGLNQRFNSFSEFREALHKYSIAHGFAYKYKKNDSHCISVKCRSEGCPWRIYVSRLASTHLVCIKRMTPDHTCQGSGVKARCWGSKGLVGNIIKEKVKISPHCKIKDIAQEIEKEYGIQLNYSQARRAKMMAKQELQGTHEEAYNQLPHLCEMMLETNPGSVATVITKEDTSFHRMFVSFQASISGFIKGCRPLLFLDVIPLYSKYQGVLLVAFTVDGNDGVFPVAFAVVDIDDEDNWRWFLLELKSALSESSPITFVSDFRKGLKESISEIFENGHHGYCLRHLAEKLNEDMKGLSHEARRIMVQDLYAAAYAPKVEDFQCCTDNIKAISSEAYNWVIQSELNHWANAFFAGARYNYLTSDFSKLIYNWVSEAHDFPITQLIDTIRAKMMDLIYTRRTESSQWVMAVSPSADEKVRGEILKARSLQVMLSNGDKYEVHGQCVDVVDISRWDCSCKGWQLTGIPCSHAIAVLEFLGKSPYDYCLGYFSVENYNLTYAEPIHPVPTLERSEQNNENALIVIPPTKRPPGKRKMKQPGSLEFIKRQLQCSKCKGLGHNKKTCR
ncbi:uncharacterized protein LOC124923973 [Impatiens glandulifera]|uniref:uncharacterized protein LOC124923973 n=1 Tax=Impatiens glandulifera TaxID=253017 RepID=UPI001FB13D0C|nr:uncharacterized protein LOC124923973 [Impatiens glandulifera]